ncbi:MAG: IS200/IS605 family transposase, partial [Chitinophagales bacterium]
TYTQIHLQLIFAVKYRPAMIQPKWKTDLYKYITGIVKNNKHKLVSINGMPDHLHLLIGMRPHQSLSDLMQDIKGDSSTWINVNQLTQSKFRWQEGYAAFSYSHSHLKNVITYIENQEYHHRKLKFMDEYRMFLKKFEVEFDERYMLREPE